jgi:hypothetical protein
MMLIIICLLTEQYWKTHFTKIVNTYMMIRQILYLTDKHICKIFGTEWIHLVYLYVGTYLSYIPL